MGEKAVKYSLFKNLTAGEWSVFHSNTEKQQQNLHKAEKL